MSSSPKPVALTLGDPAGIAGEITIKAWQDLRHSKQAFFLIGDPNYIADTAESLQVDCPVSTIETDLPPCRQ